MTGGVIREDIAESLEKQSWIRRMFETAAELKQRVGADRVFDFSLGNPDLPAPEGVSAALRELAAQAGVPGRFGYCPNAGLPELREALAALISREQQEPVGAGQVMVTCGAAGAVNALFRAILEPGDEVLCSAPYFVEYGFYCANVGARLRAVNTRGPAFDLDPEAVAAALGPATRAVLVNSPNNPTGRIYRQSDLQAVAEMLRQHSRKIGRPVFLVSDEPYRFLAYDGAAVPPVMPLYPWSVVVSSFSKSLSLAGARIGYLAVKPGMPDGDRLMQAAIMANRILGFVNAPVIAQHILLRTLGQGIDIERYDRRRRVLSGILQRAGLSFVEPQGAFYFFPRVPEGIDETGFINRLLAENVIAVPGSGFGAPGHVRFSYCLPRETIARAAEPIIRAAGREPEA